MKSIVIDKTVNPIDFYSWAKLHGCTILLRNATSEDSHSCGHKYRAELQGPFYDNIALLEGITFGNFAYHADTKEMAMEGLISSLSGERYYTGKRVGFWEAETGIFPFFVCG